MLLTDAPVEHIAVKMGLDADVVTAFSQVFFDLRVDGRSQAESWLVDHLLAAGRSENVSPALVWAYMSMAAGTPALDVLIADHLGLPQPALANRSALAQAMRLMVQEQVAWMCGDHELSNRLLLQVAKLMGRRLRAMVKADPMLEVHLRMIRLAQRSNRRGGRRAAGGKSDTANRKSSQRRRSRSIATEQPAAAIVQGGSQTANPETSSVPPADPSLAAA
jgi:hypothetical protein